MSDEIHSFAAVGKGGDAFGCFEDVILRTYNISSDIFEYIYIYRERDVETKSCIEVYVFQL